ncbi:hypothetical protein OG871_35405 [Kitasatospora sp. NBC_00374]|uniref:hypothetical protein n=1 Tax=Kitasatospora sp. NBC_00374 TaxID=2975964 RepID=UPI0030E36025
MGRPAGHQDTTFACGGPNDGDGHFEPAGAPKTFTFAAGATAALLSGAEQTTVPLADLLQHIQSCKSDPGSVKAPRTCGSEYLVKVDASGAITAIGQRYRP